MPAKLVELYTTNSRDAVATLRKIADRIEAGDFGEVDSVAVCLLGDTFEVFGMGDSATGEQIALMLQAGVARFATAIESHGKP